MSKLITEQQKREIEMLGVDHFDALVAYGADMYRDGLIKGAMITTIGVATGITISKVFKFIKERKITKHEKES